MRLIYFNKGDNSCKFITVNLIYLYIKIDICFIKEKETKTEYQNSVTLDGWMVLDGVVFSLINQTPQYYNA